MKSNLLRMTAIRYAIATTFGGLSAALLLALPPVFAEEMMLAEAAQELPPELQGIPLTKEVPDDEDSEPVPIPPRDPIAAPPVMPGNNPNMPDARMAPPSAHSFSGAQTSAPSNPVAASGASLRPGEMMFNFQEADIQAVVKTVSLITGKNFLLDPRVRGKLTIISTQPVSKDAIYQIFLAALKAQGYTATSSASGLIKLVPLSDAKLSAEVSEGKAPRAGEQTITHVLTIQNASAAQLVPLLRPLMAPTSQLSVYAPSNALIITDYADNIRNLLHIVEIVDQRGNSELAIIPLKNASAVDIAEIVVRLYPSAAQTGSAILTGDSRVEPNRTTIMADMRTNSLLIRAASPGSINDIRELVERLDVPAKIGGNTRVVYLRNAEATKLAEVLRGLLSGEARAQALPAGIPGKAPGKSAAESSQIQADEATNSLIISAPDAVFNNLRSVIEKLDVRRAQVYVEALIAEVATEKATQFGLQWAGGKKMGNGTLGAMSNFPASSASIVGAATNPASLGNAGGLTLAYLGKTIKLADGTEAHSLGALAQALEEKNIGNILSAPNLLTLDNAEAKIVVGKNVPFVTGSFSQATGTSGTVNPFQTIERKDVGLMLKIKPQISEGGVIRLQISQESSSVDKATGTGASDLITSKRSLDTTVLVDDGNTIVLGGLIEDHVSETTQAVPFLGRIPVLGWLFKYQDTKKTKTNLMIFLRPIIVRGPEDSYGFSASRYAQIHAEQKKADVGSTSILENFKPKEPLPPGPSQEKNSAARPDEIPSDKVFGPPETADTKSPADGVSP
jgi:general secretion pathway protein D